MALPSPGLLSSVPLIPKGSTPNDAEMTDQRWTIERRENKSRVVLTTLECILELWPSMVLFVPVVMAGAISFAVLEERELNAAERMTEAARAEYLSCELVLLNRFGAGGKTRQ
jgi:hypothetical protein